MSKTKGHFYARDVTSPSDGNILAFVIANYWLLIMSHRPSCDLVLFTVYVQSALDQFFWFFVEWYEPVNLIFRMFFGVWRLIIFCLYRAKGIFILFKRASETPAPKLCRGPKFSVSITTGRFCCLLWTACSRLFVRRVRFRRCFHNGIFFPVLVTAVLVTFSIAISSVLLEGFPLGGFMGRAVIELFG